MTLMQLIGAMFVAYGPAFALFIFTIAKDPLRIIIMMAGMFFWLLALLLSSIWWTAVVPLKTELAFSVTFSVIFQEAFRFLYCKILRKAEDGLQQLNNTSSSGPPARTQIDNTSHTSSSESTRHIYAYVAGLGFGLMSGLFSFINVLADSKGPGTVGIHEAPGHPLQNFLLTSAFLTLCYTLLHIVWNVLFFYGYDKRDYVAIFVVVATHFLVSLLTLLPTQLLYYVTLPISYGVLLVLSVISFFVVGGSVSNIKKALTCKDERSYDL